MKLIKFPYTQFILCGIFLSLFTLTTYAGPAVASKKNPKDLIKEATADEQNGKWEDALQKLKDAASQKPKDKNIATMVKQAQEYLADATASKATGACNNNKIDDCEKLVEAALSYAHTERANQSQLQLQKAKTELQNIWTKVETMIAAGQLEDAHFELDKLTPYPYLFPNLTSQKDRLRGLRVNADVSLAGQDIENQRFDSAIDRLNTALILEPANEEVKKRIESAKKEKEAFGEYTAATNALVKKDYESAYKSNRKAMLLFPDRKQYETFDKEISSQWVKVLSEQAIVQAANPESLRDNQKALESLQWIQRLDPSFEGLTDSLRNIRTSLYSNYVQKANDFQSTPDNARIATAYLYYLNAQQTNPEGEFAFAANLREVGSLFARKRAMQIVVNVDNLSQATPAFSDVVSKRVRAVVEQMGLPDLHLSSREDYQKNASEDPQFQDLRPGGKSPAASFSVGVTSYETESTGNNSPIEKRSQFISGQETVPNPQYEKTMEEYRKVKASLLRDNPKPGKPTKDGYSAEDLTMLERQIATVARELNRDKVSDYTYQQYDLRTSTKINMKLEIRDMLEKQLIGSDSVEIAREEKSTEISGVRDRDTNNLLNRPARMKSSDQLLKESERDALQALDEKVRALVQKYLLRFYQEGDKALREARTDDAVENFLCYWYTFRGQLEPNQSQQIRDLVRRITGLDLGT